MSDRNAEALCRLMDGELGESEVRFLLRRLGQDRGLNARWERYHLVRSTVGRNLGVNLNGFAARVSKAVAAESTELRVPIASRVGWLKPLGGAALAASVALIVFNIWRQPVDPTGAPQPQLATLALEGDSGVAAPLATPASAPMARGRWNPRLQGYLVRHNEVTAPRSSQGLVPYWYLVSEPPPEVAAEEEPDDQQAAVED